MRAEEGPGLERLLPVPAGDEGQGLATELVGAAYAAAQAARPELPVVALLLKHNKASKAVAERAGLRLVWRGPDRGNPDPYASRLVYADRDVAPAFIEQLLGY
jgi:RimJ/RimL family protein N-acetyltransferase